MQQEDYVIMPASDKEMKALSQKNKHQIKIDLGDTEMIIDVEYDDVITIDSPEKDGYEFLYFETKDGEKLQDNKLHIEDKDYVIKAVWAKIPGKALPQTGENNNILLIIYATITIISFGFAVVMVSKSKE
jgi:LPXTG-motif cell wall-anchored protein